MALGLPYTRLQAFAVAGAVVGAGFAMSTIACNDERSAPAAAAPLAPAVTARDAAGAVVLAAQLTDGRCAVTGETTLTVEASRAAAGPVVTAIQGAATVLTMTLGRTGLEIAGADGATQLRVVRDAGRTDLLTPDGIALARISANPGDARIVDAGRSPVAMLVRDGDHISVSVNEADGVAVGAITGTDDLGLAALLIAPGVPANVRALLACERLLAADAPPSAPSVSTSSSPAVPAAASPDPAVPDPDPTP